jgi:outer membrane protein
MKNIGLVLNLILLGAVGYLFFKLNGMEPKTAAVAAPVGVQPVRVAHVDIDTFNAKYEWLKEQRAALEQRLRSAETTMGNKKEALAKDMMVFQQKAQSGTVARADLEKEYQVLAGREQALAQEEQRLSKQLAEQQEKSSKELMANLESKLKSIQSKVGYDYILTYSKGGGLVLLANDSLDITKQVLELLNAKQ